MNRRVVWLCCLLALTLESSAQKVKVEITNDSTFNAAEDYAQTASGFDTNISEVNVIHTGLQLAQDVVAANGNRDEVLSSLANKSYYRQRADLMVWATLPERTNIYTTLSFVNDNDKLSPVDVHVVNLEVEHFFKKRFKIRMGRLGNAVSESQFFGRMALEPTSSHVFGRRLFINDAIEFDGNFLDRGGPVFFVGVKPKFQPLRLKGVYAGFHQPFKSGWQMHGIVSANVQQEEDVVNYIPGHQGTQTYFSYEAEVAYKQLGSTVYLNVGGNLGYKGVVPHVHGPFDFLSTCKPVVTRTGDSFKETFTPSAGFNLTPAKISSSWKFLPKVGVEAEVLGTLTDRFTAVNVCAFCMVNITRRMVLTYFCTPQFVWQDFSVDHPRYTGGVVNYLRLSVTIGSPKRMFL